MIEIPNLIEPLMANRYVIEVVGTINNMKPRVVHCKKEEFDVYIGRGSKWGNPFSHKVGTQAKEVVGSREEAIEKFEEYLLENKDLLDCLGELKGKVLGCWCKPKSCHGDILLKYANQSKGLF